MKINYGQPSGQKSINSAIDYINDMNVRSSDLSPFFKGLEGDIIKSVKHEFSASNPNKWPRISKAWREYKKAYGYPENIGIYTGALLTAASEGAIKTYSPTLMTWEIDDVPSREFTQRRKIGFTTREFLKGLTKAIVRFIIKRG